MIEFREIIESDYKLILDLYNYHIRNSTATFHLKDLQIEELKKGLPQNHAIYKTYAVLYNNDFCGYCYMNYWKPRQAYEISAETTLYLKPEFQGKGIGKHALMFLEEKAKLCGLKNLLGVITLENAASVRLFEKMGYKKVGHLKNIGKKFGRVLDVVTYQKEI